MEETTHSQSLNLPPFFLNALRNLNGIYEPRILHFWMTFFHEEANFLTAWILGTY